MQIHISEGKTLAEIKAEFNALFPHLKLEFYLKQHEAGAGSPKAQQLDEQLTIAKARTRHNEGDVYLHPNQNVGTVEAEFETQFGLHVQIFRNSRGTWLQTTKTDHWTLAEQENKAAAEK